MLKFLLSLSLIFFSGFNYDFSFIHLTHMIAASNTATDNVTIRSHMEYLVPTYNILLLVLRSKKFDEKASLMVGFNMI